MHKSVKNWKSVQGSKNYHSLNLRDFIGAQLRQTFDAALSIYWFISQLHSPAGLEPGYVSNGWALSSTRCQVRALAKWIYCHSTSFIICLIFKVSVVKFSFPCLCQVGLNKKSYAFEVRQSFSGFSMLNQISVLPRDEEFLLCRTQINVKKIALIPNFIILQREGNSTLNRTTQKCWILLACVYDEHCQITWFFFNFEKFCSLQVLSLIAKKHWIYRFSSKFWRRFEFIEGHFYADLRSLLCRFKVTLMKISEELWRFQSLIKQS